MKIDIITPTLNQGTFIERTLKSVSEQRATLAPHIQLKHIVLDGASTDNTLEILKNFSPSVRWLSQTPLSQTAAINKGISLTDGDIIGWLNSDDIYYPNTIALVAQHFEQNPEIDVIYGMADHIDVNDQFLGDYPTQPWNIQKLKTICYVCQPALFFRRRVVEQCGFLDESLDYCMDYEYWIRLGQANVRFFYLEKKLAGSRLHKQNKTLGSRMKVHNEINIMLKKKLGYVPNKWMLGYATHASERNIAKFFFLALRMSWQSNRLFFYPLKCFFRQAISREKSAG